MIHSNLTIVLQQASDLATVLSMVQGNTEDPLMLLPALFQPCGSARPSPPGPPPQVGIHQLTKGGVVFGHKASGRGPGRFPERGPGMGGVGGGEYAGASEWTGGVGCQVRKLLPFLS